MHLTRKILYCGVTDPGLCHETNQDAVSIFVKDGWGLFVLADGMGGHAKGELASESIIQEFERYWGQLEPRLHEAEFQFICQQVQERIQQVNRKIYLQYNQGQVCGATVAALLVGEGCYAAFSVGDSHIYSYGEDRFDLLSVDDIWDMLPTTVCSYTKAEIAAHVNCGKLTQAVGSSPQVAVHVRVDELSKGQKFLLCSDGLYKNCEEQQLILELKTARFRRTMKESIKRLIKTVYNNGADDNISIIFVQTVP